MPRGKLINFKVVLSVVGSLVFISGLLMTTSLPFSIYYEDGSFKSILLASLITLSSGFLLRAFTQKHRNDEIKKREGFLIVAMGWLFMAIFGSLPYLLSGSITDFSDAFFETISGLTTTGATILDNIEEIPYGILFWRSMTQWIGGMGIIVLTIAILPLLGVGGMELFVAEAPGPTKDKIHPRIKETAKRLWLIYFFLTVSEAILLKLAGMGYFDAINHALTTMSSGGFSTKQGSLAAFDSPLIEYIVIFFMLCAGTNFVLLYYGIKLKFRKFAENDEFKWYLGAIIFWVLVILPSVFHRVGSGGLEEAFRSALFQVVSILTTTGFATVDFTGWGIFVSFVFFLMLFSGSSAGSTSGGMKIARIVLLVKNGFLEFKRRLHPNAVVHVQLNNRVVPPKIIYNVMAFFFTYLFVFVIGSLVLSALKVDFITSISAVATCITNVGPGLAGVGPSETFSSLPSAGKWILSFLMLLGRLELFTIGILFTPYFWRKN